MIRIRPRIGLFGGSFNPMHQGHVNVANHAIELLKLDELIFVPCYVSVDKTNEPVTPAIHRVSIMLKLLPEKCSISTFELDQKKPLQSIVVFKYFRELYKEAELFFIMGSDSFSTIETWDEYQNFDKYVNLVVYRRKGSDEKKDSKGLIVKWVENELWDYSSTAIRNSKTKGLNTDTELYIRENKLYGYVG